MRLDVAPRGLPKEWNRAMMRARELVARTSGGGADRTGAERPAPEILPSWPESQPETPIEIPQAPPAPQPDIAPEIPPPLPEAPPGPAPEIP